MRLKSEIFVQALVRGENARGGFATVLRRGSQEAGAIFIVILKGRDEAEIYGPAPQSVFDDEDRYDRIFERLASGTDENGVSDFISRQEKFDPDFWVVELETVRPVSEIIRLSGDEAAR